MACSCKRTAKTAVKQVVKKTQPNQQTIIRRSIIRTGRNRMYQN